MPTNCEANKKWAVESVRQDKNGREEGETLRQQKNVCYWWYDTSCHNEISHNFWINFSSIIEMIVGCIQKKFRSTAASLHTFQKCIRFHFSGNKKLIEKLHNQHASNRFRSTAFLLCIRVEWEKHSDESSRKKKILAQSNMHWHCCFNPHT